MYYQQFQSRKKYGNIPTTYEGIQYHSKRESTKAWELDQLVKAKEIKSWTRQGREELYGVNGDHICNYFVDFVIEHNDNTKELLEIKSKITATEVWRLNGKCLKINTNMKLLEAKLN